MSSHFDAYKYAYIARGFAATDDRMIMDDLQLLSSGLFGPFIQPFSRDSIALFFGVRSGVELLAMSDMAPSTQIFAIDSSTSTQERAREMTGGRAIVLPTLDDLISRGGIERIDFLRINTKKFCDDDFNKIFENFSVGHICGEIDENEIDPLRVFRRARQSANSFYFWLRNSRHSVSGTQHPSEPEVSIVVPAYGVEKYLDKCIGSLVDQTLEKIEIIVVNDESRDTSGKIADDWSSRFPGRVRVLHKPNGGCASARMAGLQLATGEYVGFVDGDDWVEPSMYEDLFRNAALLDADISQCGFYEAYEDGSRIFHATAWGGNASGGNCGLVTDPKEFTLLMPSIWRRIYKREFLLREEIEFPIHIRRHDDLPFAFQAIACAERIAVIPDCHYAYRLGRPGQDVEATDERLFVHFDIFDWLFAKVRPWGTSEVMRYLCKVEIGAHRWVLGRLERNLIAKYLAKAVSDIENRYKGYYPSFDWRKTLLESTLR